MCRSESAGFSWETEDKETGGQHAAFGDFFNSPLDFVKIDIFFNYFLNPRACRFNRKRHPKKTGIPEQIKKFPIGPVGPDAVGQHQLDTIPW